MKVTLSLLRLTINFSITTPSRFFVSHFCKKNIQRVPSFFRVYCPLKSETRESWRATNFPFPPVIYNFRAITGMRWSRARLARLLVTKLTFYHDYGLVSGHASTCTRGGSEYTDEVEIERQKGRRRRRSCFAGISENYDPSTSRWTRRDPAALFRRSALYSSVLWPRSLFSFFLFFFFSSSFRSCLPLRVARCPLERAAVTFEICWEKEEAG